MLSYLFFLVSRMAFEKSKNFLNKHSYLIGTMALVIAVLQFIGFNLNVPQFYDSLGIESKVLFWFFMFFVILVFFALYFSSRISDLEQKVN